MQRTATAGFYAGFVGQGGICPDHKQGRLPVEPADRNAKRDSTQLPIPYICGVFQELLTTGETGSGKENPAKGAWNGEYDSALGRKTGAAILDYLLVAIGGALMKGESAACGCGEW